MTMVSARARCAEIYRLTQIFIAVVMRRAWLAKYQTTYWPRHPFSTYCFRLILPNKVQDEHSAEDWNKPYDSYLRLSLKRI